MKPLPFTWLVGLVGLTIYGAVWYGANQALFVMPSFSGLIIAINVITTASIYWVLTRASEPRVFTNIYLFSIVMKLIFYSALLLIIRFMAPQTLMPNAVLLMGAYLTFTVLEVAFLFRKVNR